MKSILSTIFVLSIAVVSGINVFNSQKDVELSDIGKENVEALASGETYYKNQAIVDRVIDVELLGNGCVRTTYKRLCAYGGSQNCSPGEYTETLCL